MADIDFNSNRLPVFKVELSDSKVIGFKKPPEVSFSKDTYAIKYYGPDFWTGEFEEGDIVVIDPQAEPEHEDYIVIWLKDQKEPVIEQMALSFLPDMVGSEWHPLSSAIPMLSILRGDGFIRTVSLHKIEKIHKVIGKAYMTNEVAV